MNTFFSTLIGAQWTDQLLFPNGVPDGEWDQKTSLDEILSPYLRDLYNSFLDSKPGLALRKEENGWGVEATEAIPKGTVVLEYLGEYLPKSKEGSSYRFGPIDGQRHRNFGAMVDDGFPNLQPFYLFGIPNKPVTILFIAIEDIPKGAPLLINYGLSHSVKGGPHNEYALDRMYAWINQENLTCRCRELRLRNAFNRADLTWEEHLSFEALTTQLQYIYQTPTAAFRLIDDEIVTKEEYFSLYNDPYNRYFLFGYKRPGSLRQIKIEEALYSLEITSHTH